jgi:hypothetical protein
MNRATEGLVFFLFLTALTPSVIAHGPGHMPEPNVQSRDGYDPANTRKNRLEQIQRSIDRIDQKLENPDLPPAKRAKLEKKLQKLLAQKNRLLDH